MNERFKRVRRCHEKQTMLKHMKPEGEKSDQAMNNICSELTEY